MAREFVRSGKAVTSPPGTQPAAGSATTTPPANAPTSTDAAPLDITKLSTYERYGLTVVPLFLGLLTVIALGLAAHNSDGSTYTSEPTNEPTGRHQVGFTGRPTAGATAQDTRPKT